MRTSLRSVAAVLTLLGAGTAAAPMTASAGGAPCKPTSSTRIAFAHNHHIFTVCPDGQGMVQLTRGRSLDQEPAWSPNRRRIAFARQVGTGPTHIYTMRPDGTNVLRVTGGRIDDYLPAWSPDGTQLAFTRGLSASKIFTVRTDGSHFRYVMNGLAPAWSPDGTRLAISRLASTGRFGIFLMSPTGTDLKRITPSSVSAYAADWSPNGAWLTFQIINNAKGDPRRWSSDIAVVAKDGSRLQRVTQNHQGVDEFPAWSPDGGELGFDRNVYDAQSNRASDQLETVRVPGASTMGTVGQLTTAPIGNVQGWDVDW
jgi:TolB protein